MSISLHKSKVLVAFAALAMTGCNTTGFTLNQNDHSGPPPPLGTPRAEAVDGMTVGDRLMSAGEYELALASYQRSAGEDGINAEVLSAMGTANLKLGRLNQAKTLLEKGIEFEQHSVSAWNNLGVVLINLKEYQQAREAFRVAFGLDNGDSDLIRNNLILANKLIAANVVEIPQNAQFSLVRHGNGSYFLIAN